MRFSAAQFLKIFPHSRFFRSIQIVAATLVAAPRQRNTQEEKQAIKDGKRADEIWPDAPNKALQKDTDAM